MEKSDNEKQTQELKNLGIITSIKVHTGDMKHFEQIKKDTIFLFDEFEDIKFRTFIDTVKDELTIYVTDCDAWRMGDQLKSYTKEHMIAITLSEFETFNELNTDNWVLYDLGDIEEGDGHIYEQAYTE